MPDTCVFCAIVEKTIPASIVFENAVVLAFMDMRQFFPGHVLLIPHQHIHDIRECDPVTGAALMETLIRITQAVDAAFANDGLSIWHSIGPAAHQEVPHLHFHIHPRNYGDDLLQVYQTPPVMPGRAELDRLADRIRARI